MEKSCILVVDTDEVSFWTFQHHEEDIDGLVEDCSYSIVANAIDLLLLAICEDSSYWGFNKMAVIS